jgi:phosphopentomutase
MERLLEALSAAPDRSLLFANCVDFDTNFGHRRDVSGYANALEEFDAYIPPLRAAMKPGDVAIITADHGCDPTFPGSDHTREYIPVLAFGDSITPGPIGRRAGFADIGQSLAGHLGLEALAHGISFL